MSVASSHYDVQDTIAAIASPTDPAARGIVRLTGPATANIVAQIFNSKTKPLDPKSSRRYSGQISFPIDRQQISWPCDLWYWPSNRTYTRQPSAEFHILGAPILLQKLLQSCCDHGARLAGPGEFTLRAFLAGRLDLIQAEAVLGVIHAQDPEQLRHGLSQLAGGLSHPLQTLREQLILLLAHLEAGLDFAEEDIEFISAAELNDQLCEIESTVVQTLKQLRERQTLRQLPQVVLFGAPNAGKSSLYNVLTEGDNAIVSATKGTTRDFLRSTISIEGVSFELVDTAGLERWIESQQFGAIGGESRQLAADQVDSDIDWMSEQTAARLLRQADIAVVCYECESPDAPSKSSATLHWWRSFVQDTPTILLRTKSDLRKDNAIDLKTATDWPQDNLSISSTTGEGVAEFRNSLVQWVSNVAQKRNEKHATMGLRAVEDLESVAASLKLAKAQVAFGGGEELVAAELRSAVDSLGKLVGTIYTDDLLDSIFSRFCIGK